MKFKISSGQRFKKKYELKQSSMKHFKLIHLLLDGQNTIL